MSRKQTRKRFKQATRLLDEVSGTLAVTRTVENNCFVAPPPVTYNRWGYVDKPKNKRAEERQNIRELCAILDDKGHYAGFADPRRILLSLHEDGLVWFTREHVEKAIDRKRGHS